MATVHTKYKKRRKEKKDCDFMREKNKDKGKRVCYTRIKSQRTSIIRGGIGDLSKSVEVYEL